MNYYSGYLICLYILLLLLLSFLLCSTTPNSIDRLYYIYVCLDVFEENPSNENIYVSCIFGITQKNSIEARIIHIFGRRNILLFSRLVCSFSPYARHPFDFFKWLDNLKFPFIGEEVSIRSEPNRILNTFGCSVFRIIWFDILFDLHSCFSLFAF